MKPSVFSGLVSSWSVFPISRFPGSASPLSQLSYSYIINGTGCDVFHWELIIIGLKRKP